MSSPPSNESGHTQQDVWLLLHTKNLFLLRFRAQQRENSLVLNDDFLHSCGIYTCIYGCTFLSEMPGSWAFKVIGSIQLISSITSKETKPSKALLLQTYRLITLKIHQSLFIASAQRIFEVTVLIASSASMHCQNINGLKGEGSSTTAACGRKFRFTCLNPWYAHLTVMESTVYVCWRFQSPA